MQNGRKEDESCLIKKVVREREEREGGRKNSAPYSFHSIRGIAAGERAGEEEEEGPSRGISRANKSFRRRRKEGRRESKERRKGRRRRREIEGGEIRL